MDLSGSKVAVLGGAKRELEIIRSYLASGADVVTYGVIPSDEYADLAADSLGDALKDADIIIGPMPGVGTDNSLYAPHAPEPIRIDDDSLAAAKRGAVFFCGHGTEIMKAAGERHGVEFLDIGDDDFVQVQHAIPTAEAAIALAVRETEETVCGSRCLVLGYGRIGQILASYLRGWGARVTVAARRPEMRARAGSLGNDAIDTTPEEVGAAVAAADLIFATAPALLLDREALSKVSGDALVIDLASPPGGMDHTAAEELGVRFEWARAQADSAWRHSGRAQFDHMVMALKSREGSGA
jgi:dipicolinate synthase subunit A